MSINDYVPLKIFTEIESPFISIIIAARNEEKNIGSCIQSIINQTYPANKFEIIITDDHSSDKTVSIVQSFQKKISGSLILLILHKTEF
jgi:glycosyltransferase involved in cell wall biosynthesis